MADKRLFFALWPSQEQRELLVERVDPLLAAVAGRHVDRQNWHVTLVFIGNFPEERIGELQSAAAAIPAVRFSLCFDSLEYWKKPRIASLRANAVPESLEKLVDSLKRTMIPFGYPPETRPYRPHITVARKVRRFDDSRLAQPVRLAWSNFDLVESVSVPGGVRYCPLKQ